MSLILQPFAGPLVPRGNPEELDSLDPLDPYPIYKPWLWISSTVCSAAFFRSSFRTAGRRVGAAIIVEVEEHNPLGPSIDMYTIFVFFLYIFQFLNHVLLWRDTP